LEKLPSFPSFFETAVGSRRREASFRSFSRLPLKEEEEEEEEEGNCFRSFSTLFRERIPSVCCCRVLSTVKVVHTRTLLRIDQNGGSL
jgi:hypothetical protein